MQIFIINFMRSINFRAKIYPNKTQFYENSILDTNFKIKLFRVCWIGSISQFLLWTERAASIEQSLNETAGSREDLRHKEVDVHKVQDYFISKFTYESLHPIIDKGETKVHHNEHLVQ